MEDELLRLIHQYGYPGLFCLLMLGVFGLPVPDETLLTIAGVLVHRGQLQVVPTLLSSFLGSSAGITLSYCLGRYAGAPTLTRLGRQLHVGGQQLQTVHDWFERSGKWILTFGYFFPGIRHLTAVVAGSSQVSLGVFAVFAYSGAFLWSVCFLTLGFYLGERSASLLARTHGHFVLASIVVVLGIAGYIVFVRLRGGGRRGG